MDLVKEAKDLATKAIGYDKNSFVDAAAFFYNQAARLLIEAVDKEPDSSHVALWMKKADEYKKRANAISKPKSYRQMKHPDMVLLGKCRFLFSQGLDADEAGEVQTALKLYSEAVETTSTALATVTQKGLKDKLEILLKKAQERLGEIRKSVSSVDEKAASVHTQRDLPKTFQRQMSTPLKLSGKHYYTDEEKKVLLATSKINRLEFVPFMDIDHDENFDGQDHFTDKDGPLSLSPKQIESFYKWKRPYQLFQNPKMIAGNHADCFSIRQTIISDCSFVASLSVAALYEKKFGKRLITNIIFPRKQNKEPIYNPNGKYVVKLHINGVPRKVIIDDKFPVDRKDGLLSSFSTRVGEIWISLLEKAYMKVMGGYDFPGSNSNIDLHALTGWIPERIHLTSDNESKFDPESTFTMLMSRMKRGDLLMTVATPNMTEEEAERAGLVPLHAYAVLDIRQIEGERLFQLKNPWSHVRWKGNYSDQDVFHWTKEMCKTLDFDPTNAAYFDNGVFWIDYKSLLHFFDVFYLSWNPNMFSYTYCLHQAWAAGIGPAKDCYTVGDNPQFKLKIDSKYTVGTVWILLTRHITDIEDFKYNKEYITVLVYTNNGKKVYYPYDPPPFIDGLRINSPHYLVKINLQNTQARQFTLVLSQYEKTTTIYYTLRAYATCQFSMESITDPYTYIKKITNGEWKGKTAGGCRNYPTYDDNPEYTLVIKETGNVCIDLKAPSQFRIGFDVYSVGQESLWKARTTGPYRMGFVVLTVDNMPRETYNIVPTTFKPNEEARFFLTIKSTSPFECNLKS